MDSSGVGPIRTAPHQHANAERRSCSTCAHAKTKCIPRPYGPCERCYRLKKPCESQEPAIRKPRGPAKKSSSRKEQLEAKLDNIMSLLSQRQRDQLSGLSPPDTDESSPNNAPSVTQQSEASFEAPPQSKIKECRLPLEDKDDDDGEVLPTRQVLLAHQPEPPPQGLYISDSEAEIFLSEFRSSLASHFPFIVIPPDMPAAVLRQQKPFLFRTVAMAAMYCDYPRQYYHSQENIRYFSEHLLIKGEKSLDLLQGLLVLAAWYHVQNFMNPQLTNFCSLATALVIDLGLTKTPQRKDLSKFMVFATQLAHGDQANPAQQTSEERRALLGVYYLTSIFSACFKRLEGLPFTSHLEAACLSLEKEHEFPSDLHLVAIVRCLNVIDKLREPRENVQTGEGLACPVTMYVRAFRHELSALDKSQPDVVKNSLPYQMIRATCEVQLFEGALQEPFSYRGIWSMKKLEIQYHGFLSLKKLFDIFTAFPIEQLYHMSFSAYAQLAYAISVQSRLQFFTDEQKSGFDDAESIPDLIDVLDRVSTHFDAAVHGTRFRGKPLNNDKFLHWSACLRRFKECYERMTGRVQGPASNGTNSALQSGTATPKQNGVPGNDPTLLEPMDPGMMEFFADDNFWSTMMTGEWNANPYYFGMPQMSGAGSTSGMDGQ